MREKPKPCQETIYAIVLQFQFDLPCQCIKDLINSHPSNLLLLSASCILK